MSEDPRLREAHRLYEKADALWAKAQEGQAIVAKMEAENRAVLAKVTAQYQEIGTRLAAHLTKTVEQLTARNQEAIDHLVALSREMQREAVGAENAAKADIAKNPGADAQLAYLREQYATNAIDIPDLEDEVEDVLSGEGLK